MGSGDMVAGRGLAGDWGRAVSKLSHGAGYSYTGHLGKHTLTTLRQGPAAHCSLKHSQDHQDTLPCCIGKPAPKSPKVEVDIIDSDAVEAWPSHQHRARILLVPGRVPDDRDRREGDIVGRVK